MRPSSPRTQRTPRGQPPSVFAPPSNRCSSPVILRPFCQLEEHTHRYCARDAQRQRTCLSEILFLLGVLINTERIGKSISDRTPWCISTCACRLTNRQIGTIAVTLGYVYCCACRLNNRHRLAVGVSGLHTICCARRSTNPHNRQWMGRFAANHGGNGAWRMSVDSSL